MRSAASLTIMILLGATSVAHAVNPDGGYQSQQGIWLHGTTAPFEDTNIPLAGATRGKQSYAALRVENGQLRGTLDGQVVEGAGVVGTQLSLADYLLTITGARRHQNIYTCESTIWEYRVEWRARNPGTASPAAQPLCIGDHAAVVVPGSWTSWQLQASDAVFSFACVPVAGPAWTSAAGSKPSSGLGPATLPPPPLTGSGAAPAKCVPPPLTEGGVIAKCIDYGYAPWVQGSTALALASRIDGSRLPNTDVSARQLHNLCTVAMRADYGGAGVPHTLGGTPIRLYDATNLGVAACTYNRATDSTSCQAIQAPVRVLPPEATQPPVAPTRAPPPPPPPMAATQVSPAPPPPVAATQVSPAPPPPVAATRVSPSQTQVASLSSAALAGVSSAQLAALRASAASVVSNIQLPVGEVEGLVVEGIWTIDATGSARALCLSKERWETVDRRPLSMTNLKPVQASYCDSRTLASLKQYKPLLISYSAYIDRGLHRFSNGTDQITTTHVRLNDQGDLLLDPAFCSGPLDCSRYHYQNYEGTVLSPYLGDLITEFRQYQPRRLYSYRDGNRAITTADNIAMAVPTVAQSVPQGTSIFPEGEGYLFVVPPTLSSQDFAPNANQSSQFFERVTDQTLSLWQINGSYITAAGAPPGGRATRQLLGTLLGRVFIGPSFGHLTDLVANVSIRLAKRPVPAHLISPVPPVGPVPPKTPVQPVLPSNQVKPTNR